MPKYRADVWGQQEGKKHYYNISFSPFFSRLKFLEVPYIWCSRFNYYQLTLVVCVFYVPFSK